MNYIWLLIYPDYSISNWLRIESESKYKIVNLFFFFLSQYPALNTVASHKRHCLDVFHDFKCSILSVICFVFTRYTLHVLRGTLAPSPHLRARQLERLPPSYREQRIREWRGLSPSVHCPSAWSTHTIQHTFKPKPIFMFRTHGCTRQGSCTGDDLGPARE